MKAQEIPLAARIVAVVDVFDALLHSRPYKDAWLLDDVLSYLVERKGKQFDPDVIDALLAFLKLEKPDWLTAGDH